MAVFALYWQAPYEGQQLLGVFATREEAEAARRGEDDFVSELELGRLYEFDDIGYGR